MDSTAACAPRAFIGAKDSRTASRSSTTWASTELAANLFRATQTEEKLRREQIATKDGANAAHLQVGQVVRRTIQELGGTLPEQLPTPEASIKQLEAEERSQRRQAGQKKAMPQLPLFPDDDARSEGSAESESPD